MEKQVVFLIAILGVILVSVVPLAGQDIVVDFDDLGISYPGSWIPANYIDKDPDTEEITPGIYWYGYLGNLGYACFMTNGTNPSYTVTPHSGSNYAFNYGQTGDTVGFSFDASVGFDNVLLKGGWFAGVTDYPVQEVRFVGYDSPAKTNVLAYSQWQTITDQMSFVPAIDAMGTYFGLMGYIEIEYWPEYTITDPSIPTIQVHRYAVDDLTFHRQPVAQIVPVPDVHPGNPVTLDGNPSYDPDENIPLTYQWEVVSKPSGSVPELSNSDTATPSFTADLMGDYEIQLIVTDSNGGPSQPEIVAIGTYNTAPVADAGKDQAFETENTVIQLGLDPLHPSWDPDGDPITYLWYFVEMPTGSEVNLDNPTSATPWFETDLLGIYEIALQVTDSFGAQSTVDSMFVTSKDIKPVAVAGENQSEVAGDTVFLDGSGSYDEDLIYELEFQWTLTAPEGSAAVLDDPSASQPSFVADIPGTYEVQLIVNDGLHDSEPDEITITAVTSSYDEVVQIIMETVETINDIALVSPESFKNIRQAHVLTDRLNAVLTLIDEGYYEDALYKLQHDILPKTNGCAETGAPDRDDWIRTCDAQEQVYPLIMAAIALLDNAINP